MRQQGRHLVRAQRPFLGIEQLVPAFLRRRILVRTRYEFVPRIQVMPTRGSNRSSEHMEQHQSARGLPSAQIAGGAAPPQMRCETASGGGDLSRRFDDDLGFYSTFFLCKLRSELRVVALQRFD